VRTSSSTYARCPCYQEIGLANPLRPAHPYFAAFDETTHDFDLVLEDLGRLRVADQTVGCAAADVETARPPRTFLHGEDYAWVRVHVCEFRDGRLTSMCEFEHDDEDAAFACAPRRMRSD
jgi:hypothetical protein